MDTKIRSIYMLCKRDSIQIKRHTLTTSEGDGKRFHANDNKQKS